MWGGGRGGGVKLKGIVTRENMLYLENKIIS